MIKYYYKKNLDEGNIDVSLVEEKILAFLNRIKFEHVVVFDRKYTHGHTIIGRDLRQWVDGGKYYELEYSPIIFVVDKTRSKCFVSAWWKSLRKMDVIGMHAGIGGIYAGGSSTFIDNFVLDELIPNFIESI